MLEGLTAVVLAGGRGTRLASVIDNVPKPLVSVAGRPFLAWLTAWLIGQGVSDLVYSTGHLGDQIQTWVSDLELAVGVRAQCHREPSPLGTGGAVLACLDVCQDRVLVINGDTLLLTELAPLVSQFEEDRLDGLVVGIPVADASRFGTLEIGENGLLRSFREKQPGGGVVNGGIYLFRKATLEGFLPVRAMSLEKDLLPELLRQGARIPVITLEDPFLDIGVPEALARADSFVSTHGPRLEGSGS
jgi:D-glycero-alpha-D-manno-heptose 1-phosphate guanylyltransferase